MANLEVNFCGVKFKNPTVLASGILGVTASSLKSVIRKGAGGVTTKSIWLKENVGHKNPTMYGTENYFLNAVGLSDAGMEKAAQETFPEYNKRKPGPIIANIVAGSIEDFGVLAEEITKCDPDIIEVNIACPNVEDSHGKPFACVAGDAAAVTRAVRARTNKPIIIKLTPNVFNIGEIAKACADAGADGFCAINTLYGMGIDINVRRPILTNKSGGLSGPGIKPAAVKAVYEVYKATKLPIIGTGGIMTGEDAIEIMMAGATLVGMGTMVYYRGAEGFGKVAKEMAEWCDKNGVKDLEEIIGCVHN
ncbi:MAG: dihydroorotate dehydrogenase [Candidatus Peregrinibacteria bacterium]|nr:dihydroorotate dehydrogenase [Candidatus Peregrinibacteria bacterium]